MYHYFLRMIGNTQWQRAKTASGKIIAVYLFLAALQIAAPCQVVREAKGKMAVAGAGEAARDRELASLFAPTFYQGLGDHRRADYVTNFDFDGDWRGDNNWEHADDLRFPLRAFVYYAVSETVTHYFIHYAVFHPRDYKGGGRRGPLLSEAIKEGVRRGGKYDPTGLSAVVVLAHENDMEGCLVVVAKNGTDPRRAKVELIETLSHDRFLKYVTEESLVTGFERVAVKSNKPQLYIEPKGHGISAYAAGKQQLPGGGLMVYQFAGVAGNPEEAKDDQIGYDLIPLFTTLWPRAMKGINQTYGAARNYKFLGVGVRRAGRVQKRKINLTVGSAFLGRVGASNMARPPWGWFDRDERESLHGEWFFEPAKTVKRHFNLANDFSLEYMYAPFLGVTGK
ncbi:MAG: hypothetical protein ACR2G4_01410 [Pyrinomonadaceae bacterium]